MLGLGDFWVTAGFVLSVLSVILCIAYGVLYWNEGDEAAVVPAPGGDEWDREEKSIEENL